MAGVQGFEPQLPDPELRSRVFAGSHAVSFYAVLKPYLALPMLPGIVAYRSLPPRLLRGLLHRLHGRRASSVLKAEPDQPFTKSWQVVRRVSQHIIYVIAVTYSVRQCSRFPPMFARLATLLATFGYTNVNPQPAD